MWPVCLENSSRYILFHFCTSFKSWLLFKLRFCIMCCIQFLVSKLVACCTPKTQELCDSSASQALSLLHMLTVDSDSSMYDYVKVSIWYSAGICCIKVLVYYNLEIYQNNFLQELEPFPELKIFDEIRKFHKELCHTYSIRDHLAKVNKYHFLLYFYGCTKSSFKIILSWYVVHFCFQFVKKSSYLPPRLLLSRWLPFPIFIPMLLHS